MAAAEEEVPPPAAEEGDKEEAVPRTTLTRTLDCCFMLLGGCAIAAADLDWGTATAAADEDLLDFQYACSIE